MVNENSTDRPLITVIMALYNAEKYVRAAIDSLLTQSFQDFELIVADGGSSDGTVDILKHFSGRLTYFSEKDKGVYDAWNKALKLRKGEWVMFLGGDDVLSDVRALELVAPVLKSFGHGSASYIYSEVALVEEDGQKVLERMGMPWEATSEKLTEYMSVPHCGAFHHTALFDRYGNFDTSFRITGDYDFVLRITKGGEQGYYTGLPLVRMTVGGLSANPLFRLRVARENIRALEKNGFAIGWKNRLAVLRAALVSGSARLLGVKTIQKLLSSIKHLRRAGR